jgi:hypothetical protein
VMEFGNFRCERHLVSFLVLLVCFCVSISEQSLCSSSRTEWHQLNSACLSESLSISCSTSDSLPACLLQWSRMKFGLVVQWRVSSRSCCSFHHHRLCRLQRSSSPECQVFTRLSQALLQFVTSLRDSLAVLWVSSGVSEFDNLVCNSGDVTSSLGCWAVPHRSAASSSSSIVMSGPRKLPRHPNALYAEVPYSILPKIDLTLVIPSSLLFRAFALPDLRRRPSDRKIAGESFSHFHSFTTSFCGLQHKELQQTSTNRDDGRRN